MAAVAIAGLAAVAVLASSGTERAEGLTGDVAPAPSRIEPPPSSPDAGAPFEPDLPAVPDLSARPPADPPSGWIRASMHCRPKRS